MKTIRLGSTQHEQIVRLWWTNPFAGNTGDNARSEIVSSLEAGGNRAYVDDGAGHGVGVGVVDPAVGAKNLSTYVEGDWTNKLLTLPRG